MLFCVFSILFVGYALGRITIKGVSLGDAGVFIVALLFGALFFDKLDGQLVIKGTVETVGYADSALSIIQNLGLILFVTAVGFIAGPKFFGNMKKNFKSYVLLGLVVILAGGLSAVGCIFLGRAIGLGGLSSDGFTAMIVGRLVWGAAMFVCIGIKGGSFTLSAFLSGAVTTALPGIAVQIVLIPILVMLTESLKTESAK